MIAALTTVTNPRAGKAAAANALRCVVYHCISELDQKWGVHVLGMQNMTWCSCWAVSKAGKLVHAWILLSAHAAFPAGSTASACLALFPLRSVLQLHAFLHVCKCLNNYTSGIHDQPCSCTGFCTCAKVFTIPRASHLTMIIKLEAMTTLPTAVEEYLGMYRQLH